MTNRPLFWYAIGVMLLFQAAMRAADGVFNYLFWANVVTGLLAVSTGAMHQVINKRAKALTSVKVALPVFENADSVITHEQVLRWLPDHIRADLGYPVTKREDALRQTAVSWDRMAVEQTGLLGIPYPPASEALVPPGTPIPGWAKGYFQPELPVYASPPPPPPSRPSPTRGELR